MVVWGKHFCFLIAQYLCSLLLKRVFYIIHSFLFSYFHAFCSFSFLQISFNLSLWFIAYLCRLELSLTLLDCFLFLLFSRITHATHQRWSMCFTWSIIDFSMFRARSFFHAPCCSMSSFSFSRVCTFPCLFKKNKNKIFEFDAPEQPFPLRHHGSWQVQNLLRLVLFVFIYSLRKGLMGIQEEKETVLILFSAYSLNAFKYGIKCEIFCAEMWNKRSLRENKSTYFESSPSKSSHTSSR